VIDVKTWITFVAVAVFAAIGRGAEKPLAWPQFRGPGGSGVADGQKPPVELGPDKNVKWKVAAPGGLSSPVVAGDR
jgi:outer membrane protein assembly factor BamB